MGPVIRRALFLCALLAGLPALASVSGAVAPIRLVEPVDGAVWTAGESAALAWAPEPGFEREAKLEEWEAFLSVDGGLTFPVRLTPHLDIESRRVLVRVPDLPTERARLLLRVGDERQERSVDVPIELRIVRASPTRPFCRLERAFVAGETARAGDRPALFWSEGRRDGRARREREAALPPTESVAPAARASAPLLLPATAVGEKLASPPPAPVVDRTAPPADVIAPGRAGRGGDPAILLLTSRRNE